MRKIKLTKGKYALVDAEDFEYLNQWKWSFDGSYAVRGRYLGKKIEKYKYEKIYLHRVINKTPKGFETDHINGNKLDNRKINLRSAKRSLNNINRHGQRNNTSGVQGVYWDSSTRKWRAEIGFCKKNIKLGRFINIQDAKIAREQAERRYYGI